MGVQINGDTGNISATKADYSGNVTIGGTLTYEDVTNIDSVGLITAREGIEVGARPGVAASISVDGNAIFSGITTIGGNVKVGTGITLSPDGDAFHTGVVTATTFVGTLTGDPTGSGANLTSLPAAQLTGTLPAISGANLTGIVAIPSGGIILWSGAADAIPSGFVLCDGNNSTPNLSGKFVVGYSASDSDFDVGDTGGSKDATLVSHSHTVNSHTHGDGSLTATNTSLTGSINRISESFGDFGGSASGVFSKVGGLNTGGTPGNPDSNNCGGVNFNGSHTHDVSGSTGSANPGTNSQGSSASNANLPPYYALCYIMKS